MVIIFTACSLVLDLPHVIKQIGMIIIQEHEILRPNIHCLPLAMQPTLALRAAKHMGVIGLPWQPICQETGAAANPRDAAPWPGYTCLVCPFFALFSGDIYSVLKHNLCESKTHPFECVNAIRSE